jgi:hypothetical protein
MGSTVISTESKPLAANRSPKWAFMEKFVVPNFDTDSETYLTRWRLIQTPWFGIYLHRIGTPDSRPTLHDHPWDFTALVLRGGYIERRLDPMTMQVNEEHRIRFVNRMRTHDAHAITRLFRVPTWTLVFVGARRRTWGYFEPFHYTEYRSGVPRKYDQWHWTEFDQHAHADEFDKALQRRREHAA